MRRSAIRPVHWVIFLAYCIATGALWFESSLSGYAGSRHLQRQFLGDLPTDSWSSGPCTETLSNWVVERIRSTVSRGQPTDIAFMQSADRHLARYAALRCPSGSLLVAGRIALSEGNRIRQASGMAPVAADTPRYAR